MCGKEIVARVASAGEDGWRNNNFYFFFMFPAFFFPWGLFLLEKGARFLFGGQREGREWDLVRSYPFIWFLSHFLFFSFVFRENYEWYALDWVVPLALLAGSSLRSSWRMSEIRFSTMLVVLILLFVATVMVLLYLAVGDIFSNGIAVGVEGLLLLLAAWVLVSARRRVWSGRGAGPWFALTLCLALVGGSHLIGGQTGLMPAVSFKRVLDQETEPYTLVSHDRFLYKRLHLFDLKNMQRLERVKKRDAFYDYVSQHKPTFLVASAEVFSGAPADITSGYRVVIKGWRPVKQLDGGIDAALEQITLTGKALHLLDAYVLARRME
jgi:hypothetical protein